MKITSMLRVAVVAGLALIASLAPFALKDAKAQTVVAQPAYAKSGQTTDLGNGPIEIKVVQGSVGLFTSLGTGVGSTSGSSTSLTLTAVPTTAPCVGCIISGTGITSGTTVASYNGVTTIGLSTAMTVGASTALAWGAACPTTGSAGQVLVQASVGTDLPYYTQARVCARGNSGPGAALLTFPIGAH